MTFSVKVVPSTGLGIGVFTGRFDPEANRQALVELWNAPDWNGRGMVWDLRAAKLDVTPEDVREFAQFILQNQPVPPPSRVAFVAAGDFNFGTLRMFEGYREDERTKTFVTRDYDEAVAWASAAEPTEPGRD